MVKRRKTGIIRVAMVPVLIALGISLLLLTGCGKTEEAGTEEAAVGTGNGPEIDEGKEEAKEQQPMDKKIILIIDSTEVESSWEDNESITALKAELEKGDITIDMSMYGGFEQVGPLGVELPRKDVQTTTACGDIVLYSGNQIVLFYGSNSWAYTRLGRIEGLTEEELTELLGSGNVRITITLADGQ